MPDEIRAAQGSNPIADLYTGMTEETFFRSPVVEQSYDPPYNGDDLWQKKGDYSIYETMLNDDQVSVCLQLKKDLVLGEGAMFVPGEDGQEEIEADLKKAFFEDYEGDFIEDLEEILTSYEFGFSLTEKVFALREKSMLGLKRLRTRHPNSWRLYQDDKGDVSKFEQITIKGDLEINPKSLIHYVNGKRFQNPYGNSDLRAAYNAWFTKTQVVKYFAIFLEKAASPIPVGRYDKNAPQAAVDKLFESLKKFQAKTALVIPKEIETQFLEAKNNGDAYIKAIQLFNMFIGRALFIPDLLGFTGSETGGGSLALGEKQMNIFFLHINRRRNALENMVNKELVWPVVAYNHGFIPNYPKFKFKPLDDMKAVELAKVWLEAVKGRTYKPSEQEINHFRKLVKFPEGDVEFHEALQMESQDGEDDEKDGIDQPDAQGPEVEEVEEKAEEKKEFAKAYDATPGDYARKVDFKAIKTKLNDYDQSVMDETSKIVRKMMIDLMDQIERKKIVQNGNVDRMDSLSLKYKKELKQVLKASFSQLYKDAQVQAATELDKSTYASKPLTSEKFNEVLEEETFRFVGDYEYGILKKTKAELTAAIKDGKPLSAVTSVLSDELKQLSDIQLERFARTKHTEVMNNARVDYFDSTGVVAAYQYSAILDDRTSEICDGLHGKIFVAGEQPIPPMHFNCRSTLIPITKYEKFTPTKSIKGEDPQKFIDENKGAGFSQFVKEEIEVKPEPKITDDGVSFTVEKPNQLTEIYHYSKDGLYFQKTTIVYSDDREVVSVTHEKV